ncbi:class I SAM-dependent methyltransferase, partial [Mycoplasmopsis arginini]|uniref:class I SAM-dependent methyltransferase n=1 Tax=Mycoplasmopsis arginini TaxID=2094 RepID=UPI00249EE3CE
GPNDLENEDSFYRTHFYPRFIKSTSEEAYYDFFVRQDIKIDFLFIDGDHTYEGVKLDFDLYSNLLSDKGVIVIHDTDEEYEETLIISEDSKKEHHRFDGPSKLVKELEKIPTWNLVSLHNFRILADKPSSSGITIINKRKW